MKYKVAIITQFHGSKNYGGVLQAFALQSVVEKLGYDCEILKIHSPMSEIVKECIETQGALITSLLITRSIVKTIFNLTIIGKEKKRTEIFNNFRNNLRCSKNVYTKINIKDSLNYYDAFITGSDQVWNFWYSEKINPIYWLTFVPKNKLKFSYAASMGITELNMSQKEQIKDALSPYNYISVREDKTKNILDSILNGSPPVEWVLDPVFLLNKSDWNKYCLNRKIKEKYIFAYLLGNSLKQRKFIKNFCKQKNLKLVTIPYLLTNFRLCDIAFGNYRLHDISPFEFISLIKYSEHVFTDSFHVSVYSVIYEKSFFIFKRHKESDKKSMNSRIYSLSNLLETSEIIVNENNSIEQLENIKPIDFNKINTIIKKRRDSSLAFLDNALKQKEG